MWLRHQHRPIDPFRGVLGMEDVEVVDWRARGNQYGDGVVGIAAKKTDVVVVEEGMRALEPSEPR